MIGKSLSHFKITAKLGEGGMGEVYLGEDTELDRQVAIKVLPPDLADDPERLERFRREAKAVAALNHPNIVTIYAIEESEGTRFLIMELIEGKSLDALLSSGDLPLAKVFDIAVPIADALAAAHDRGIVHRDLKPANVMVTGEGRVKVLDFGLAKLATEAAGSIGEGLEGLPTQAATATASLTREGAVMGTAPYMSPEQLQGLEVDHRTDIFSLGIVLFEMITGRRPFKGATGIALASSILKDSPPPVTELREQLPRHLARIVGRCLEKDAERRYQSVKDVRNELEDLREEALSGAQPATSGVSSAGPSSGSVVATDVVSGVSGAAPPSTVPPTAAPPSTAPPSVAPSTTAPSTAAPPSGAVLTQSSSRRGLFAGAAVALLFLVALGAWWMGGQASSPTTGAQSGAQSDAGNRAASVAVLPFADLSPEKDQEYFTDGMTEEILQALGTIEDLKVPSRTAVFALKGKDLDIQQVGERLGVATVLEGSVRKAGNRLRISTQLIQVDDGFNLWSETYDRELDDVFAIQDEIANSIADALRVTFSPADQTSAALGGTQDTDAYDLFLRAEQYRLSGDVEDQTYAIEIYQKAIEKDPVYALAWVGLAMSHARLQFVGGGRPADLAAADQASAKALTLAPELGQAHLARAIYFERAGKDDDAEREYKEAIRIDPENFEAYHNYGSLKYRQGDLEQTAVLWERTVELDPDGAEAIEVLPQVYHSLGQEAQELSATQRLVERSRRRLELYPDDLNARLRGASGLMLLGQRDEATEWSRIVEKSGRNDPLTLYNLACVYSIGGEVDRALDFLERSVEAGAHDVSWFLQDSDLDNLRDEPRFKVLIEGLQAQG